MPGFAAVADDEIHFYRWRAGCWVTATGRPMQGYLPREGEYILPQICYAFRPPRYAYLKNPRLSTSSTYLVAKRLLSVRASFVQRAISAYGSFCFCAIFALKNERTNIFHSHRPIKLYFGNKTDLCVYLRSMMNKTFPSDNQNKEKYERCVANDFGVILLIRADKKLNLEYNKSSSLRSFQRTQR